MSMLRYFLFCVLMSVTVMSAAKPTLTLATTTWEPYVRSGTYKGYVYEIVTEAFAHAGYNIDVKFMSWPEAKAALKSGKVDGIFPEYYAEQDTAYVAHSVPFSGGPLALFKRRDNPLSTSLKKNNKPTDTVLYQLRDKRFGVVAGYVNTAEFDDNPTFIRLPAADDAANLRQLYEKKVDVIIIDKYTADHILQNQVNAAMSGAIEFMPPLLGYKKLYVGITKKRSDHQQILQQFAQGLTTISNNGKFAAIIDRDAKYTGDLIA